MIKDIIKLADHLDMSGHAEEAKILDDILPFIEKMESSSKDGGNENYMVHSQLKSIIAKAQLILKMCEAGSKVDDWMETYIAQSDLMIDNICDKLATDYDLIINSGEKSCGCTEECECDT